MSASSGPRDPTRRGTAQRTADTPILCGRVGRAHGLDGSFYVTRPLARLLRAGTPVNVGDLTRTIVRRAGTDARPILRVDGVDTRDAVEALRGEQLSVDATHAPELGPDEYWSHELEGCRVYSGEQEIGVIERLIALPSCEVLQVRRLDSSELLVPMVRAAIRSIDVRAARIDIDLEFLGDR